MVHEIDLCLSRETKSIEYELPPLNKPLTLETTDGSVMSVVVTTLDQPDDQIISAAGQQVVVELPISEQLVRYRLFVEVPVSANGIMVGKIDGQVVGRILLLDSHTRRSDTLVVALGGLSAEWWFETTSRPANSSVWLGLITSPSETGRFHLSEAGWSRLSLRAYHLVVADEDWLEGGYFAIKASFPR